MIEVSVKTIVEAMHTIEKLCKKEMSVKTSFNLARLEKRLREEAKIYDEQRLKICQKYGTLNSESNQYTFKDEDVHKVESDFAELFAQKISIDADKISLDGENIKITAEEISAIIEFLEV